MRLSPGAGQHRALTACSAVLAACAPLPQLPPCAAGDACTGPSQECWCNAPNTCDAGICKVGGRRLLLLVLLLLLLLMLTLTVGVRCSSWDLQVPRRPGCGCHCLAGLGQLG